MNNILPMIIMGGIMVVTIALFIYWKYKSSETVYARWLLGKPIDGVVGVQTITRKNSIERIIVETDHDVAYELEVEEVAIVKSREELNA